MVAWGQGGYGGKRVTLLGHTYASIQGLLSRTLILQCCPRASGGRCWWCRGPFQQCGDAVEHREYMIAICVHRYTHIEHVCHGSSSNSNIHYSDSQWVNFRNTCERSCVLHF